MLESTMPPEYLAEFKPLRYLARGIVTLGKKFNAFIASMIIMPPLNNRDKLLLLERTFNS